DLDAFEQVIGRAPAHRLARVAEAAELVVELLEEVRVDRPDAQPERAGRLPQSVPVSDTIPGDVQRDRRRDAGQAVDDGGVLELLEHGARRARLVEDSEAGTGVA